MTACAGDPLQLSVHETGSRSVTVEWISSSSDIQYNSNYSGFDVEFDTNNGRKLLRLENLMTFTTYLLSFKGCVLESDCTNITLYPTTLIASKCMHAWVLNNIPIDNWTIDYLHMSALHLISIWLAM